MDSSARRALRRYLYELQKHKCVFCGRFCSWEGKGSEPMLWSCEHIIPLRFGGRDHPTNLIGCCYGCNAERAKEIDRAGKTERRKIKHRRQEEQRELSRKWKLKNVGRGKLTEWENGFTVSQM